MWQRVANTCECCEDDPDCPIAPCLGTVCSSNPLPVSCTLTGYPFDNDVIVTCDGICNDMVMTTNASVQACYGCPYCEDDGDPNCSYCGFCAGEMIDNTGTFEVCTGAHCPDCYGIYVRDTEQTFNDDAPCYSSWSALVERCGGGGLFAPQGKSQDVDLSQIFTAYSVTYSAGAMGSYLLTKSGEDLCAVWGYSSVQHFIILYVYETTGNHVGGCRKYCFETNDGLVSRLVATAGDHINCVNAQTTGSSIYDLGLTATGSTTKFMFANYHVPNTGQWVRLDTGGTVDVKSYPPPKAYFTFEGEMCPTPPSCTPSYIGLSWSMISDTKQRTDTGVVWNDAYCPYNYSWSVTDMGPNIEEIDCTFSSA